MATDNNRDLPSDLIRWAAIMLVPSIACLLAGFQLGKASKKEEPAESIARVKPGVQQVDTLAWDDVEFVQLPSASLQQPAALPLPESGTELATPLSFYGERTARLSVRAGSGTNYYIKLHDPAVDSCAAATSVPSRFR